MLSVSATELLACGEAGGLPLATAVFDEEERLLSMDVALHRAADDWASAGQVFQDL